MNQTVLWTALALAGAYIAYEVTRPSSGVREIGDSSIKLEGDNLEVEPEVEQQDEERDQDVPPAPMPYADAGAQWDQDDRARQALEARQAEQDAPRMNAWKQKGNVGTKKAKSLARRDQRRAYFEYVRQEAEQQRMRIQEEEEMFGDLIAEEREERQARIQEAKEALDEQNRARRAQEEEERLSKQTRRSEIEQLLRDKGIVKLNNDMDIEIAEDISGALVLENGEYAVSITQAIVDGISDLIKSEGRVPLSKIQELLPKITK